MTIYKKVLPLIFLILAYSNMQHAGFVGHKNAYHIITFNEVCISTHCVRTKPECHDIRCDPRFSHPPYNHRIVKVHF